MFRSFNFNSILHISRVSRTKSLRENKDDSEAIPHEMTPGVHYTLYF